MSWGNNHSLAELEQWDDDDYIIHNQEAEYYDWLREQGDDDGDEEVEEVEVG